MQIECALNGRDRHFVQIGADGRQRCRVVRVFTRSDAAEINLCKAGATLLDRHRRQELHNVLKFTDLQLVELFVADGIDRDRHVLQILFALCRCNNDDIAVFVGSILRESRHCDAEPCRCEQHGQSRADFRFTLHLAHEATLPYYTLVNRHLFLAAAQYIFG